MKQQSKTLDSFGIMTPNPSIKYSTFAIGNPLLDICIEANDALFSQWNISVGAATLATPEQIPLYSNLASLPGVKFIAGGSAQNTIRGVQWIIGEADATTYVGAVGKDDNASLLRSTTKDAGVDPIYYETDQDVTGTCAVLIKERERSLIANIAACSHFDPLHLNTPQVSERINQARIFYATGFLIFSPRGMESLLHLGQYCLTHNKIFLFNFSAPYVLGAWDKIQLILPYVDYVICNEVEASTYASNIGLEPTQHQEAALHLMTSPKLNTNRQRTVIFTEGPKPTIVAHEGKINLYHPIPIDDKDIVDLNGAGDGFAAGIIAGLARGIEGKEMIDAAHYAAHDVIQHSGAIYTYPCSFKWSK